jgi:hypothetical protein
MSAEIIDFTTRHRTPRADDAPRQAAGTLTATAKNARLRLARREVWWKAEARTDYWRALLDFMNAVLIAKDHGLTEVSHAHTEISEKARLSNVDIYRQALGKQLLTPAPDAASVNWKRHQLSKDPYIGVKKELVEKAIADDVAFLDAHPTGNSRANKLRKSEVRS